jgi:hypothetical protein
MGEMRNVYNILVGKYERKRPLARPRHRWKASIKMDLREIGWEYVDWIHLARPVAGSCEPSCYIKGRKFLDSLSDY